MGRPEVVLRYCTNAGDEVRTTWEQARADLIVEGLPIRVPPTYRGQRNYPGLFWASTNRRSLVYESLLELDRLWLADFDPEVRDIATQPFQIVGRDGSTPRKHVPDILFLHRDRGVTLVDVKPAAHLDRPEVKAQKRRPSSSRAEMMGPSTPAGLRCRCIPSPKTPRISLMIPLNKVRWRGWPAVDVVSTDVSISKSQTGCDVTNRSRRFRPLGESVFFPALWRRIIFFPFRLINRLRWRADRIQLRIWRIKNVDRPYKAWLRAQKRR